MTKEFDLNEDRTGAQENVDNIIPFNVVSDPKDNKTTVVLEDIEATEVKWLYKPYFPLEKVALIVGNPGEGKTTFALYLAAQLSNGLNLDGTPREMGAVTVLFISTEDGIEDTIKPRLIKFGADCNRIHTLRETEERLTLGDGRLERAIEECNPDLVIIDPVQSVVGADTDINKANQVREKMDVIIKAARKYSCAIVLICHMNKNVGSKGLYRVIGSMDFVASARSSLIIGAVEGTDGDVAVLHNKANLSERAEPVAFNIEDGKVTWLGNYEITEEELLGGVTPDVGKKVKCDKLIRYLARYAKYVPAEDMFDMAKLMGVSKRTMNEAKKDLGITSFRSKNSWVWMLRDLR